MWRFIITFGEKGRYTQNSHLTVTQIHPCLTLKLFCESQEIVT